MQKSEIDPIDQLLVEKPLPYFIFPSPNADNINRERMQSFLSAHQSVTTLAVMSLLGTVGCSSALRASIGTNQSFFIIAVSLFRLSSAIPCWAMTWCEYYRQRKQTLLCKEDTPLAPASWIGNLILCWWALTGGVMLVGRCMVGKCIPGMPIEVCNPYYDVNGLPITTLVVNFVGVCCLPALVKIHDEMYTWISFGITALFFVVSLAVIGESIDLNVVCALAGIGLWLYEYERGVISLFTAHHQAHEYYKKVVRTTRLNKSIQEENEHICTLMGNVSHDLKTPLQSFMSEVDILSSTLDKLWEANNNNNNTAAAVAGYKHETDESITNLQSIYCFMMIAIKRGEDFSKATAGVALQSTLETFSIAQHSQWAVDRMAGSPTGVGVRLITLPPNNFEEEGDVAADVIDCALTATRQSALSRKLCPMIITDKHWFCENILSLASNALKFTMKGTVEVEYFLANLLKGEETEKLPVIVKGCYTDHFAYCLSDTTAVTVTSDEEEKKVPVQFVIVLVRDTGIGIAADKKECLFQAFSQAQRRTGGTGLGLFSIRKRMEALGGHCGVQDREDGKPGTCFWLAYPYAPDWQVVAAEWQKTASPLSSPVSPLMAVSATAALAEAGEDHDIQQQQQQQATSPSRSLLSRFRQALESSPCLLPCPPDNSFWESVLIVEDSPIIQKAMVRSFENEGFRVDLAPNGCVGLEMMQRKEYALVVTDIQMPLIDGCEMTRRFREEDNGLICPPPYPTSILTGGGELLQQQQQQQQQMAIPGCSSKRKQQQIIVGMSANSDMRTQTAGMASGMDAFIPKPVTKKCVEAFLTTKYTQLIKHGSIFK